VTVTDYAGLPASRFPLRDSEMRGSQRRQDCVEVGYAPEPEWSFAAVLPGIAHPILTTFTASASSSLSHKTGGGSLRGEPTPFTGSQRLDSGR